jgi:hypothetical protein
MPYISGAVEGISDEAVLRRVVTLRRAVVHRVQVQHGKANLRRALPGYNAAAQGDPWLVLVDLDHDFDCAAALVTDWLPAQSTYMRFRVVVREIEAWLLADRERFTTFFSVPASAVPDQPDELPDAKSTVLAAIVRSRRKAIRVDMLPRPGSGRQVGAVYTSRLIEFASDSDRGWRPSVAAQRSPSLSSCLTRLDSLIEIAP